MLPPPASTMRWLHPEPSPLIVMSPFFEANVSVCLPGNAETFTNFSPLTSTGFTPSRASFPPDSMIPSRSPGAPSSADGVPERHSSSGLSSLAKTLASVPSTATDEYPPPTLIMISGIEPACAATAPAAVKRNMRVKARRFISAPR